MPTSLALDPRFVLWSAPEPQRAGRPLILAMHGWSYDERHLFAFAHLFPAQMVVASVPAPYAAAGDRPPVEGDGEPMACSTGMTLPAAGMSLLGAGSAVEHDSSDSC
jgi:hypothetical protein